MFASGVPALLFPCAHLTCLLLRWVPPSASAHTVPHTPQFGVACTPPVVCHVLGTAAEAPWQPVRHSGRAASSKRAFSWEPFVRQWSWSQGRGGPWECGISGSWSAVAPSLHHPPSVLRHPPSFLPPPPSVLGLLVVVAPALEVALAPAVVAMVLALVALHTWHSCLPCCGPWCCPPGP